jgi:RNA 2',3'-cyclic 3'-phosphodiesterase
MMSDEKSIRAFLAIELPAEILNEIGVIQARLKNALQGVIRWVRPQGIHLTLKFLGDISERDVVRISLALTDHTNGIKPFALDVKTLGVFPDLNRPRIIWLGIGGDVQPLMLFQKSLDQRLCEHGFTQEERSFKPHLTLARVKEYKGLIGLAKVVEKKDNYTAGHFDAGELTLFRSQLTPTGAVYTKLACFPFAG